MLSWLPTIWDQHVPSLDWPNNMHNETVPGDVDHIGAQIERQGILPLDDS